MIDLMNDCTISILEKRISKLEKHKDNQFLEEVIKSYAQTQLSIVRLEEMVRELEERKKTPHKCPVCDGIGFYWPENCVRQDCTPCEGKGIVWG